MAAVHYKKYIDKAVAERLAEEQAKPVWTGDPQALPEEERSQYRDDDLCTRIAFLKSAVVVSSEGTNERAVITQARKHGQEVDAVENFKRRFDYDDPEKVNTGIAFLIVCDMLLTGFDAPIEQVMYIDKKVKNHNLLQTIARVNRVARGKTRGYIVDYIGLTDHLKEALSIYAADDQQDLHDSLKDIASEVPVLEARYRRLIQLFQDQGVAEIEPWVQQKITDPQRTYEILEQAIEGMKDLKQRANFEVYLKKFLQSMDIILPNIGGEPVQDSGQAVRLPAGQGQGSIQGRHAEHLGCGREGAGAHQRASHQPGHQPQDQAGRADVAPVHQGARSRTSRPRPKPVRWNTPSASTARFTSTKTRCCTRS